MSQLYLSQSFARVDFTPERVQAFSSELPLGGTPHGDTGLTNDVAPAQSFAVDSYLPRKAARRSVIGRFFEGMFALEIAS